MVRCPLERAGIFVPFGFVGPQRFVALGTSSFIEASCRNGLAAGIDAVDQLLATLTSPGRVLAARSLSKSFAAVTQLSLMRHRKPRTLPLVASCARRSYSAALLQE
jgi:hypothetical protein